jgi:CRP-like cAMP-binding protein
MVELFGGLTQEELQAIVEISHPMVYNEGDIVFAQGEDGDSLYIIRQGQVAIAVNTDSGVEQTKVVLGEGQIFGEVVLIDYGTRSATVRVLQDNTQLDLITRGDFIQLCEKNTLIGYIVMRNLAIDLAYKLRRQNMADKGSN